MRLSRKIDFFFSIHMISKNGHTSMKVLVKLTIYILDRLRKSRTSRMRQFVHCAMPRHFLRCSWFLSFIVPFDASQISYSPLESVMFCMCTYGGPHFSRITKASLTFPILSRLPYSRGNAKNLPLPAAPLLRLRQAYNTIVNCHLSCFNFAVRLCTMHKMPHAARAAFAQPIYFILGMN
jgi:hypothetical protein